MATLTPEAKFAQYKYIQDKLDEVALLMEAAKTADRTRLDRHVAICFTKLEDIICRWEKHVVDFDAVANAHDEATRKTTETGVIDALRKVGKR